MLSLFEFCLEFIFPKGLIQLHPIIETTKKSKDIKKQLEFLKRVADNLKEDEWCYPPLNTYLGLQ
ncbi:hypothetical protein QR98_0053580 [Sarcoptes scabiei]|uniref:Uncharacterized protein n=1 Tax=Sarcoptes scabiei TaxID=52283 RepID=A0A132A7D7_SARSC|nr:hypothetical protein QR98_0053580 [Sarcoptes scabiei]